MSDEVVDISTGSAETLELNLLHIAWGLLFDPLRLNKSGAPNRRSVLRIARGIVMPGGTTEIGEEIDLSNHEQIDHVSFLLAVSIELGLVSTSETGSELQSNAAAMDAFFGAPMPVRTRKLVSALGRLRMWNELSSHRYTEPHDVDAEHLSLLVPTGEHLIGARGAMFSVLRRMEIGGEWIPIEEFVEKCLERADDYLERALQDEVATMAFAHAIFKRALVWAGFAEVGKRDGENVFRLNERGRLAFEYDPPPALSPTKAPCLIVQPNLEITVMLDPAGLDVLHRLYRIAERRSLADRVATFALTARTVQRGYANGATAEEVKTLFEKRGMTPLPDSIKFQLDDWERVHRRVAVYADGILFRHPDPDQLDIVVGQLRHENQDVEFVRLGPSTTFCATTELEGLDRAYRRDTALAIDYLGPLAPSLLFVGPLEIELAPMSVDIVTSWTLDAITEIAENGRAFRIVRIDPELVRKQWPKDPFHELIAFLEPRVEGGVPAAQYLRLRGLLDSPAKANVLHDLTVVLFDSAADGDRLAESPEFNRYVERRLGPQAFAVHVEQEKDLLDYLHEIGVRGGGT